MKKLKEQSEWQALSAHKNDIETQTMQAWFAKDPERFRTFSLQVGEILLDYSKNRVTDETLQLLFKLAKVTHLKEKIAALLDGNAVNTTEGRAALHSALRHPASKPIKVKGVDVMPEIKATLKQMRLFSDKVRNQTWLGATGKPITDIVNIGIGGSHLGPQMALHALSEFTSDHLRCHFISNIDGVHFNEVLKQLNPETTLFIISSKTFTTIETTTNTETIRAWLQQKLPGKSLAHHFVAVTAAKDKAIAFGIPKEQIFPFWDWVGGRYSVWSAIGLPLALMIGMDHFLDFLGGAHAMDLHFREADFDKNMPVILALLGVWYINFFDAESHAVIPYAHELNYFRAHLQQLDMESNGKGRRHDGSAVDYATGSIVWGDHGSNGQHAFHQLLHQGRHLVPIDFILMGKNNVGLDHHHDVLFGCCLSQAEALLQGKSYQQAFDELRMQGYSVEDAERLAPHKEIPGNRPSNVLLVSKMTPHNLGALLALYEHKIFVQGVIWDINSFDQWGVELGKQLLPSILSDLQNASEHEHDASTLGLINHYKKLRDV